MADGSQNAVHFSTDHTTREVSARLDEQYHRIFQVQGTIETAMKALDAEVDDDKFTSVFSALALATQTLTDIAHKIEPATVLKEATAAERASAGEQMGTAELIPTNPLCYADDARGTLENAHTMMELINALDCNEGTSEFEMPVSGPATLGLLRKMVQDSIRYAADLSHD
jgi:hypothetical protein